MNETLRLQIQNQLDNAQSYDIVQLPAGELDFPIIISKPCTIVGQGTIFDTTQEDVDYIIRIETDGLTLSDIVLKNKSDKNGVYAKTSNSSIERISINGCDTGIFLEKGSDVDLIELKTFNSTTGIRIKDCKNMELNACSAYNNSIGLDVIGTSSIIGNVDSYQGFGLNVNETDVSMLVDDEEYEFKIDGMIFSFKAAGNMTYGDIVVAINNIIGFNPTYKAEFYNKDIIIKTQASTLKIEVASSASSLINSLSAPLISPTNNTTYSYVKFGLNVNATDSSPIVKGTIYTFGLDGSEVQFFSSETDGTTYAELAALIGLKTPGYTVEFKNNDIYITKNAPSVIVTEGTRFGRLFTTLGKLPQGSNFVVESHQLFGLSIAPTTQTNLGAGDYFLTVNNTEYKFTLPDNTTYQQLVDIINANTSFRSKYIASVSTDVKILTNTTYISIEKPKLNLFQVLGVIPKEAIVGLEINRTDRSHHIDIVGSLFYENGIGVRLTNVNDVTLTGETKIFSNTNIVLWQMPNSYNVKFRGEIYNNANYGIRNTDR